MSAETTTQRCWPYEPLDPAGPTASEVADRPMVCTLPATGMSERIGRLRQDFVPRILEVEEIDGGRVYWFARTDDNMALVADFALFESRCCDFLSFGIGLHPGGMRLSLRVTGPHGSAAFLDRVMDDNKLSGASGECGCGRGAA